MSGNGEERKSQAGVSTVSRDRRLVADQPVPEIGENRSATG
jgi:hypothetical protein